MTDVKEFNPIETARKVEDSYREYIATTIHFDDADLQKRSRAECWCKGPLPWP